MEPDNDREDFGCDGTDVECNTILIRLSNTLILDVKSPAANVRVTLSSRIVNEAHMMRFIYYCILTHKDLNADEYFYITIMQPLLTYTHLIIAIFLQDLVHNRIHSTSQRYFYTCVLYLSPSLNNVDLE